VGLGTGLVASREENPTFIHRREEDVSERGGLTSSSHPAEREEPGCGGGPDEAVGRKND